MAVAVMPAMGPTLGSAAGLISMLEEEQVQLQTSALRSLNAVVDTHWAEVAGSISVIEALYEDEFFASRDLAALLASKVRPPLDLLPPRAFCLLLFRELLPLGSHRSLLRLHVDLLPLLHLLQLRERLVLAGQTY